MYPDTQLVIKKTHPFMFNDFMFKQTFTLPFKQTKYFQNLIWIYG